MGGPVLSQDVEVTDEEDALDEAESTPQLSDLELEGDIAADYVEGLLDIADLDGDNDMDVEGDRAIVSVPADARHRRLPGAPPGRTG